MNKISVKVNFSYSEKNYLVLKPELGARSTLMSRPRFHVQPRSPTGSHRPCRPHRGLGSSDLNTGTNNGTREGRLGSPEVISHQIQTDHVHTGYPQAL